MTCRSFLVQVFTAGGWGSWGLRPWLGLAGLAAAARSHARVHRGRAVAVTRVRRLVAQQRVSRARGAAKWRRVGSASEATHTGERRTRGPRALYKGWPEITKKLASMVELAGKERDKLGTRSNEHGFEKTSILRCRERWGLTCSSDGFRQRCPRWPEKLAEPSPEVRRNASCIWRTSSMGGGSYERRLAIRLYFWI
jgi:hypothetical protein